MIHLIMFEGFQNYDEKYKFYLKQDKEKFENYVKNNPQNDFIWSPLSKEEFIKINEDTSCTGGPVVGGGMGAVVSAQPSSLPGVTIGANSGTVGSGDISVPYNPGTGAKLSQKIPVMGYNHGPRTGKKSRTKKLDIKQIRNSLKNRQDFTKNGERKVMSFDDFYKNDINKITKIKESLHSLNDVIKNCLLDMTDKNIKVVYPTQLSNVMDVFNVIRRNILKTKTDEIRLLTNDILKKKKDIHKSITIKLKNINYDNFIVDCINTLTDYLKASFNMKFANISLHDLSNVTYYRNPEYMINDSEFKSAFQKENIYDFIEITYIVPNNFEI